MYKVMIVGHGFVGSAVASLFSEKEKVIIDPKFSDSKISDNPGIPFDAVFVSVDTPKAEGFKLLDSILQELDYNMVEGTQFVANQQQHLSSIIMFLKSIRI